MFRNIDEILRRCVGPYDRYCSSCGLAPDACYITTPLIGVGKTTIERQPGAPASTAIERQPGAPASMAIKGDSDNRLLDSIVAFDRAEASDANITQTNLITVSSFNGLNGALLGYDLLAEPPRPHPIVSEMGGVPVFDAEPIFDATRALYGTIGEPHFPIMPGQHTVCAYKTRYDVGPATMYGALAIGIAEDRSRNADLFMEDHGVMKEGGTSEKEVIQRLVRSVQRIGENLRVRYGCVFVGVRTLYVGEGEIGCVLTAAPYVHVAQQAIPDREPELLREMTTRDWLDLKRAEFLQSPHGYHESNDNLTR